MGNILDKLITVGVGLALLAGTWFIWFLSGVANNLFSEKKWSWRRMLEDVVKTLLMAIGILAWVVVAEVLDWYTLQVGMDISQLLDGASITGLIAIICGGSGYYLMKAFRNFAKFIGTDHVANKIGEANYEAVAQPIKDFIETITTKTDKEHLQDEGASEEQLKGLELSPEEIGMGGFANTYPEPYASAPQDSMTDPSTCYNREAQPAGTMITLEDGSYKAVEDLVVGDRLWNHDGTEIVTVKSLWQDMKPVYTIRTGLGDIRFTGEHPLFTRQNRWKALARGNLKAFGEPRFVKTRDLQVGDKILVPYLSGKSLGLTPNELRFLGFYLGDGTKSSKSANCPVYRVVAADGRKRDFLDSLGIAGSYAKHSKSENAMFFSVSKKSSPNLRRVLDTIDNKSFGHLTTPEDAEYIVEGYLQADGCHIRDNVYSASSTDKKLLLAIQRMVVSMGGTMSIHKRYDAGELEKFGTKVYAKTLWDANINLSPKRSMVHEFKDGKYATITEISINEEPEQVYNIEVSGSHTYIADNHGVHNCVSYCAWKIKELTGNWPKRTGGMNAKYWVQRLAENGYTKVVSKPQNSGKYIGVTEKGQYGHVIWFEEDNIVSEYNYSIRGGFSVRAVDLSAYKWVEIQAPATKGSETASKAAEKAKKDNSGKNTKPKDDKPVIYVYKPGDTLGQVIRKLGLETSNGLWGANGDVAYYTEQLHQQGIYGNIGIGTEIKLTPRK